MRNHYTLLTAIAVFFFTGINYVYSDSLYFFTSDRIFVPTEASVTEARIGVTKYTDSKFLELNIGATVDVIGLNKNKTDYSFGVDFFTYSNLRSEDNFKFPVDAIDYLFGVNFNMRKSIKNGYEISSRFRISHISSHLQDGHIYERTDTIFTPFIFSKEFLDLSVVNTFKPSYNSELKSMLSLNYIFHAIPEETAKFSGQIGLEGSYYFTQLLGFYLSNDINIASVKGKTNLNENLESGIIFGKMNTKKIRLYFRYYDGQDYRGQYYGNYFNYKGIGLKFSF